MQLLNLFKMKVRFAEKTDLPQIIDLCMEHAAYEKSTYDVENKAERLAEFLFGQLPCLKCLVVMQEDIVVGYATFIKQFSTWEAGFYLYLDCLFLKESARGKGTGTLLMQKITAYATEQNCHGMQWQTPVFNKKAISFYHKIGGISKKKERFYLKLYEEKGLNNS
jgi:L-amino acid N-acyltransferase YncA